MRTSITALKPQTATPAKPPRIPAKPASSPKAKAPPKRVSRQVFNDFASI